MVPYNQKTVYDIISEDAGSELFKTLIFAEDKSWATVNEDTSNAIKQFPLTRGMFPV